MAVTKDMIRKKLAQATPETETIDDASAQTMGDANRKKKPSAQAIPSTQPSIAPPAQTNHPAKPIAAASAHLLTTIRLLGRTLDDLERLRIMSGNRTGAAERRGIDPFWMAAVAPHLDAAEHAAELELKRAWRKHPLAAWAKAIPGAGEVLMGRLVAEIGEPHLREVGHWEGEGERREWVIDSVEPRTLAQLRSFCGHGDPLRAGQVPKGATQEELFRRGSPGAKKAVWKLAYQFMRTVGSDATDAAKPTHAPHRSPRSPYRDLYEQRKAETEGKLHERNCVRCGPSGKPALPGSVWSDAHRHADALRIVGKEFLRDLHEASQATVLTNSNGDTSANEPA